jgi:UDP-N-acetylmuramoyl-tripeptide--D-alanyl-D-alanine ligase
MILSKFWIALLLVAGAQAYLTCLRLIAYLRYFQQEGYEYLRFIKWVKARSAADPAAWLSLACAFLVPRSAPGSVAVFVAGALLLVMAQPDPRQSGKVPLRMTSRATRVLMVSVVLAALKWVALVALSPSRDLRGAFAASVVVFVFAPLLLVAANMLLVPYEQSIQDGFEAQAKRRVDDVKPFIIGITGSYGKSSSKAMLAHILQFKAPTLAASGSINTLMGLTRHIREELVDGHRFMVVEMGAFKTGSIRRLCQLTPPSAGLITAVGDMHLERFGSTDEIIKAKSELAQALPPGALLVVNADSPGALTVARSASQCRVLLYGEHSQEALESRLEQVAFTKKGTSFVLKVKGRAYSCFTPLLGRPIILNLAGAFTLAAAVGVDPDVMVAAIRTLRPVSNRLEVVEERGVTWIRDAYNANQFGFRAALEVAAALPVSRRFLATPGVVELGADQFQVNRTLSKEAAAVCDTTLVVADANREAFIAGHRDAGREGAIVAVRSRGEAFRWLRETVKDGDAVILENDLPDLYERSARIFWKTAAPKA